MPKHVPEMPAGCQKDCGCHSEESQTGVDYDGLRNDIAFRMLNQHFSRFRLMVSRITATFFRINCCCRGAVVGCHVGRSRDLYGKAMCQRQTEHEGTRPAGCGSGNVSRCGLALALVLSLPC